ncbi:hypothetical protein BAE44_0001015, partial [Dichanthelium oligosanthes]
LGWTWSATRMRPSGQGIFIVERKYASMDYDGAKKFALKAQSLFPTLEGIAQMVTTFSIYLASTLKIDGNTDGPTSLHTPFRAQQLGLLFNHQERRMLHSGLPATNASCTQYYRKYLNLSLRCRGCKLPFLATETRTPADEHVDVVGTDSNIGGAKPRKRRANTSNTKPLKAHKVKEFLRSK